MLVAVADKVLLEVVLAVLVVVVLVRRPAEMEQQILEVEAELFVLTLLVLVVLVSSSLPILLDNHQKTLYNNQVFNILVTLGMKTLSVVGEVSWWYNEEGVYTLLFSIIN